MADFKLISIYLRSQSLILHGFDWDLHEAFKLIDMEIRRQIALSKLT